MVEDQNTEWKETWKDEWLKWICGFANAQGGRLYIGINDEGLVTGVENSKKLLVDLPNKIQMALSILCDVNLLTSDGKEYLEVIIPKSSVPVNIKGEYYYRSGSTNQRLAGNNLTRLLRENTDVKWESVAVDDVMIDDLDHESIAIFKREAQRSHRLSDENLEASDWDLMMHLGLTTGDKLTRAAVLLFHRNPEKWFVGAYTKIGMFDGAEIRYMDEVHGSLILQADRILDLIYLKYLKMSISYHKYTRVESYQYSKNALKEAIYNALCHSNWASGIPIQIKIEEDKMLKVANSCVFPETWTEKTLFAEHNSVPYNPAIAQVFFRAGYIESWGRGIKKICDGCKEIGAKKPEYVVHGRDIMVLFKPVMHTPNAKKDLTERETAVLKEISANPAISIPEIALNLALTERQVKYAIASLKQKEIILRSGSNKAGEWTLL